MNVFLTGATGHVGYATLKKLAGAGHNVKGLVQAAAESGIIEKAGGIPVIGDLLAPGPWSESVKDCDMVISASSPYTFGEIMSFNEAKRRADTHTEMVVNLLEAAKNSHVKAAVLTCHVTAFGGQGERWVSELLEIDPIGYARTTSGNYWRIERAAHRLDIPTIEVFPGWTYGSGGWFEDHIVKGLLDGILRVVGAGGNYISPVHIDDLAEAMRLIVENMPIGERYCIVDEKPVTQLELTRYTAELLGVPAPRLVDFGEYEKTAGEVMAETMGSSVRVTNTKAMKELGFRAVYPSMREGFPDALERIGLGREAMKQKKAVGF